MGIDFYFHKFDKDGKFFDGKPSIQKDLPVGECIYEERQTHSEAWFWEFFVNDHDRIFVRQYCHADYYYTEIPEELLMICAFKLDQVINGASEPVEEFPKPTFRFSDKYDYSRATFMRFRAVVRDLLIDCRHSGHPLLFRVWA